MPTGLIIHGLGPAPCKIRLRHVGVLEAVGFKFGRWVDTILMQRALGLNG